jgi:rare lipoprotein A
VKSVSIIRKSISIYLIASLFSLSSSCGLFTATYMVGKGAYLVTKTAIKGAYGTGKVIYKIGKYTFEITMAPVTWPLTHNELETIDGLSPKEAIRLNRVKMAPYVVNGKEYKPMSLDEASKYEEKGIASWYGEETRRKDGGHMTANGEVFNPDGLNAAHKYLPLPSYVKVTNLENGRSIILRVNDRGPFIDDRIIDLSAGAAKKLGFFDTGTARVKIETIEVEG